jgi:hypothetical protein
MLKLAIGNNPWQCACLRETIIWARLARIQIDDSKFNPPLPHCVVVPENGCLKDLGDVEFHQVYDKYFDGVSSSEQENREQNRLQF